MDLIKYFQNRISTEHLKSRLTKQVHHSAFRFGGKKFLSLYIENIEWIFVLLKFFLKLILLYKRGQDNTLDYRITSNE